jgi:hypothetical protein
MSEFRLALTGAAVQTVDRPVPRPTSILRSRPSIPAVPEWPSSAASARHFDLEVRIETTSRLMGRGTGAGVALRHGPGNDPGMIAAEAGPVDIVAL